MDLSMWTMRIIILDTKKTAFTGIRKSFGQMAKKRWKKLWNNYFFAI